MQERVVRRIIWVIVGLVVAMTILFAWQRSRVEADSASAFAQECGSCHAEGASVAKNFPLGEDEGRARLIDLLLADGNDHPTYAHLSDERIAAALNHIVGELDGTREFAPSEIARRR